MDGLIAFFTCCGGPMLLCLLLLIGPWAFNRINRAESRVRGWWRAGLNVTAKARYNVRYWADEHMAWIVGDKPPHYDPPGVRQDDMNAEQMIRAMTLEIIKIRYLRQVVGVSPVSDEQLSCRLAALRRLEEMNPRLRTNYSPTRYTGHSEGAASDAYGWHDWLVMKRTLDLIRSQDKDYNYGG